MYASVNELWWWMMKWTLKHMSTLYWHLISGELTKMAVVFTMEFSTPSSHPPPPFFYFFISTRQNFLQARIHTSHLHTGARKCIPAARVAIWWQAVGGREDELCQWQPLKRTTHSPVAGEAWWMIISRCDRCGIGGGALTFHPFLPSAPRLSFSHLAYISDSALTLH